jgi:hypothetical protein
MGQSAANRLAHTPQPPKKALFIRLHRPLALDLRGDVSDLYSQFEVALIRPHQAA